MELVSLLNHFSSTNRVIKLYYCFQFSSFNGKLGFHSKGNFEIKFVSMHAYSNFFNLFTDLGLNHCFSKRAKYQNAIIIVVSSHFNHVLLNNKILEKQHNLKSINTINVQFYYLVSYTYYLF